MQHDVVHGPSHALLRVNLDPGEQVITEAGAMVTYSDGMKMEAKLNAGQKAGCMAVLAAIFIAFVRKLVGGDSFFVSHFTAPAAGGSVTLAPSLNGSIDHRRLGAGEKLMLTAGAYLASTPGLGLQMRWGGCSAIFSKEGAFFVEAEGPGELWFNSYGGIHAIDVDGTYMVDNGHIVAFDPSLTFTIKRAGKGLMGSMASGEGLVCQFAGKGKVYIQSRNVGALVSWLAKIS